MSTRDRRVKASGNAVGLTSRTSLVYPKASFSKKP